MKEENIISKGVNTLKQEGITAFVKKSSQYISEIPFRATRRRFPALYYPAAEKWYRYTKNFDTDNWDAPLNPYKVAWINPEEIEKMTGREMLLPLEERREKFGSVKDGRWDVSEDVIFGSFMEDVFGNNMWAYRMLIDKNFEETVFFQSCKSHFKNEKDWENTVFYNNIVKGFEKGKPGMPGYGSNKEEFKQRLSYLDSLYTNIENNGMYREEEVNKRSFSNTVSWSILADISRDGEFLFVEGRRRLTIAKLLDIEKVPVRIQIRHSKWMDYRDKVYNEELSEKHPDFAEFQ